MADILDNLDELTDDDDGGDELLVNQVSDVLDSQDQDESLSEDEARELTDAIRSTAIATYVLLSRAYEGNAFKALGYTTWRDYVMTEFDFSAQRSYQLLDLSKTISAIESATPEGTDVVISEAQARDIKRELPRITEEIRQQTDGATPEESTDIVDSVIADARTQPDPPQTDSSNSDGGGDNETSSAASSGGEDPSTNDDADNAGDNVLQPDSPDTLTDQADTEYVEFDVEGGYDLSDRDAMTIWNFFSMISSFDTLPSPSDMVQLIPQDRADEVSNAIVSITGWFNNFHTLWEEKEAS